MAHWQKKGQKIIENNHSVTYIRLEQVSKLFPLSPYPGLGVVHKLRLQERVGGEKKPKTCQRSLRTTLKK